MFATRSELLEKIRLGEDSFLELKEVKFAGGKVRGPSQDGLADELAAFANSGGGQLFIGVNDDGSILGNFGNDHVIEVFFINRDGFRFIKFINDAKAHALLIGRWSP